MADDLASAACSMNTQYGYSSFIEAREKLRQFIKESASYYVRVDLN